jgi:hypothetical protein
MALLRAGRRAPKGPLLLASAIVLAATAATSDGQAAKTTMLQNLMKRLNGVAASGRLAATAKVLGVVKSMGPEEYAQWKPIADKARAAALAGDAVAMKAACNSCHDQYREAYRNKYGSKGSEGKEPVPIESE